MTAKVCRSFTGGINLKLKDNNQLDQLISALFSNGIPHEQVSDDVICLSSEDRTFLESTGLQFEEAKVMNLSTLSLQDRNAFKEKSRQHYLATRDKDINELIEKYGA